VKFDVIIDNYEWFSTQGDAAVVLVVNLNANDENEAYHEDDDKGGNNDKNGGDRKRMNGGDKKK